MQIHVKSLTGNIITLEVEPSYTIETVKALLEESTGYPKDCQRLICAGQELKDERTLLDSNLSNDSYVHFILYLKGGGIPMENIEITNIHFGNQMYPQTFEFHVDNLVKEEIRKIINQLRLPGHEDEYELVVHNSEGRKTLRNHVYVRCCTGDLTNITRIELRFIDPLPEEADIEENLHRVDQRRDGLWSYCWIF